MQTGIKIIKRAARNTPTNHPPSPRMKSDRERERERADTVKAWIADWNERKRALQKAADSIISSIKGRRESSTRGFTPELI